MRKYIEKLYDRIKRWFYLLLGHISPERLAKILYRKNTGRRLDLDRPDTLNAKINYLKFRTDIRLWTQLADKYRVREYVEKCGLGQTLPKLYGVWKRPEEIVFTSLPARFVLKTNNGSGSVLLVGDKNSPPLGNWDNVRKQLGKWMKEKYGIRTAELHYRAIEPLIIAEEYLDDCSDSISILDYKVHCCSGEPQCIVVCHDRVGHTTRFTLYQTDWTPRFDRVPEPLRGEKIFPRPQALEEMLAYSRILSKDFPFVRVDWYVVDGKPYFGEMTFTPSAGFIGYITPDYLDELGARVTLPQPAKKE